MPCRPPGSRVPGYSLASNTDVERPGRRPPAAAPARTAGLAMIAESEPTGGRPRRTPLLTIDAACKPDELTSTACGVKNRRVDAGATAASWVDDQIAAVRDVPSARIALVERSYHGPFGVAPRHLPYRRAAMSFMRWQPRGGVLEA